MPAAKTWCRQTNKYKKERNGLFYNWCFWTVVLEKTLKSSLDSKEIKPVNPKGNQPWIFIGRTDSEAEAPILRSPDMKNWLIRKDTHAGKDRRQDEMGMTEDEMVGWHHRLDGHVWVSSRSRWWTGKPGMLQSMGSQGVRHDWVTELNWTILVPSPKSRMEKNQVIKRWTKEERVEKGLSQCAVPNFIMMWPCDQSTWSVCWHPFPAEGSPSLLTLKKPVASAGGRGLPLGYYCRSLSVGIRGAWLPGTAIKPRAGSCHIQLKGNCAR